MTRPVFVDTSALYAVLDGHDRQNLTAGEIWVRLITSGTTMVTHSAVIHECSALVQRRLGMAVLRDLHGRLLPLLDVEWVDPSTTTGQSARCSPPIAVTSASSTGRRSR